MLFRRVGLWKDAPIGTLGFYRGGSILSNEIAKLEPRFESATDFTPSHVFMKFDDTHVVEAMHDSKVNSVAALDNSSLYELAATENRVRFLIPPGNDLDRHSALLWLINNFGNKPYGTSVLFGFLLQRLFRLKENPLGSSGDVCSQAAWLYLHQLYFTASGSVYSLGDVFTRVPETDAAPLNLYQVCLSI